MGRFLIGLISKAKKVFCFGSHQKKQQQEKTVFWFLLSEAILVSVFPVN